MKNKNIIFGVILAVILLQLPNVLGTASLSVTLSKYEPFPVGPGQTVKVWLLVQNTASDDAHNVLVTLKPEYPFTLYGQGATKTIPILGGNKDYLVDFTLKVDNNAVQGANNLKVSVSDDSNLNATVDFNLQVFVQSQDTTVVIDSVSMNPEEIEPGSTGKLTITVKNLAPTTVTDLSTKLFFQGVVGSTIVDLPFAPMDSGAEKRIYQLNPGQTVDFTYDIRAYPDAVSKVYKIPITLNYYDSLGNLNNKSDFIGIVVNSAPEIYSYIDKTDLSNKKRSGSFTLKIVNKGLSDAKFLNVIMQQSPDFDLLSTTDTTYVGSLVSDDYQTVDYKINIKSTGTNITLPLLLQYRDANNKFYEEQANIQLNLVDSSELTKANGGGGNALVTILVILVIGAGIWIFLRNRAKKNKKGQF